MKKIHLLLLGLTICLFSACHGKLWDAIDDLDFRVARLEELCKEMNTNITSIQTIVNVFQSNDVITSIVEIEKDGEVIGYTITFAGHDPITIYHGSNGADGKDGSTPMIGVAQDTDGVYYWTLNGEWPLDDNGNKLPVSGKDGKDGANGADGKDGQDGADGKDGQDGENGKDGADGQDGKDGVTPQLKIEEGYWFISYDNGTTWTQLGKATGENGQDGIDGADGKDGQNGADGKDGQDGDSMFQSVTQDENYVYFTLADGTVIKIAKASEEEQPNSEFMFIVTYDANGGEGVMQPDTFFYGKIGEIKFCTFTKEGYCCTEWNTNPNGTGASYQGGYSLIVDRNIVLYAQWSKPIWSAVDLGLSVKWASMNIGATKPEDLGDYFAWGEITPKTLYSWATYKWCRGSSSTLTKYTNSGYIIDNKTILEAGDDVASLNWGGSWRIPTNIEMTELCERCTWSWTTMNGMEGYKVTSRKNSNSIFLPAAGYHNRENYLVSVGSGGYYWTSVCSTTYQPSGSGAYTLRFLSNVFGVVEYNRCNGMSIRPVCP